MNSASAQTTVPAAPAQGGTAGSFMFFLPYLAMMFGLYYVLILLPQRKEQKKRDELLSSIQRGDKVLTRGGIYGIVADIKEQILILKISENSKVEIDRSYVESVQKNSN